VKKLDSKNTAMFDLRNSPTGLEGTPLARIAVSSGFENLTASSLLRLLLFES
tara:strand:+ start:4250 stop:4405 length:156 start_codon:yes stop_codon:yes gene_type:complete